MKKLFSTPNGFTKEALFLSIKAARLLYRSSPRGLRLIIDKWPLAQRISKVVPARRGYPRYYLPEGASETKFLSEISDYGVSYVLMRWSDHLEHGLGDSEDLDILVSERDFDFVASYLRRRPGGRAVDLYSARGEKSDYNGLPYYPAFLAEEVLASSITNPQGIRVPNQSHSLILLIYHCLFHKGARSGIPGFMFPTPSPEHAYFEELEDLVSRQHLEIPVEAAYLKEYLESSQALPPPDLFRKLYLLERSVADFDNEGIIARKFGEPEEILVVVRELAYSSGFLSKIKDSFDRVGLILEGEWELSSEEAAFLSDHMRGGNWGPGPFPVSGGAPCLCASLLR
ncbi:hypothetical protein [Thioalkalivibrio sp. ALE23]|uniref:hypothetical protein n=1 Tax=Thioalkalivibrio sp. ALE23 TaxID=1265495 RepID=UPI0012DE8684|nr:hypothetical protein [Thioalkalivibrio sp. ALE23]